MRISASTISFFLICVFLISCTQPNQARQKFGDEEIVAPQFSTTNSGETIATRFPVPEGYTAIAAEENSFAQWLRDLPLKPAGAKVHYYDGRLKQNNVYDAVIDMDPGKKNLQQCADAAIRLRAEYLYAQKKYDDIIFHFTSGFAAPYSKWQNGYRVRVLGNDCSWVLKAPSGNSYASFRQYLDVVFSYAGTLSLQKELTPKNISMLQAGDVFIWGGSPGHAVIVTNVAINPQGKKIFMLAQSYMPAQDIQILKNENEPRISPWYRADFTGDLQTPEWIFRQEELRGW